jgi:hypothetical protein
MSSYVWVKFGRLWWPGELVERRAYTEEMRAVAEKKGDKLKDIARFFDEDEL